MSYLSKKRRRDMRRQRWQFLAVGVTVVIGVMMFAATYDSYLNLTASYEQTYDRLAFADMTITGGDETLPETIEAIPGVQTVTVRHTANIPITIGDVADGLSFVGDRRLVVGSTRERHPVGDLRGSVIFLFGPRQRGVGVFTLCRGLVVIEPAIESGVGSGRMRVQVLIHARQVEFAGCVGVVWVHGP